LSTLNSKTECVLNTLALLVFHTQQQNNEINTITSLASSPYYILFRNHNTVRLAIDKTRVKGKNYL